MTQVVDGNWGVHADIPKWVFEPTNGAPFNYGCTTSGTAGRRLQSPQRRALLIQHGVSMEPEEYANALFLHVSEKTECGPEHHRLADKLLDAKINFAKTCQLAQAQSLVDN